MSNLKGHNVLTLLDKIEDNAKEFEYVPKDFIDEDFIVQAIKRNALITRFLKEEHLYNDKIAHTIALCITNHKEIIKNKLQEPQFYYAYICQKINNQEMNSKNTYINKQFFSNEENTLKVIKNAGFFKLKYVGDNLRDKESIVDMFCNVHKANQIWASERIKEEASFSGVEVSQYVKTKLYYQSLDTKFPSKKDNKPVKI